MGMQQMQKQQAMMAAGIMPPQQGQPGQEGQGAPAEMAAPAPVEPGAQG